MRETESRSRSRSSREWRGRCERASERERERERERSRVLCQRDSVRFVPECSSALQDPKALARAAHALSHRQQRAW
eukprot:3111210-Rhodomonas_salina.1